MVEGQGAGWAANMSYEEVLAAQMVQEYIRRRSEGLFVNAATGLPAGTVSSSGQINAGATANFATAVAAQLGTVHSGSFLGTATTNNLAEGFTNLYYTDARVKTKLDSDVVHSGSFLGTATTTNLAEGTNLYFTNARVLTYVDSLGVYSSSAQVKNNLPEGTISSSAQIAPVLVTSASYAATASLALGVSGSLAVNTDGLSEGIVNLYYTDARVKTKLNTDNVHSASFLGTATTTNLTEGVNLYFTNQRVKDALPGAISSSAQYPGWVTSSAQINTGSFTGSFSGSFRGPLNGVADFAATVATVTTNTTTDTTLYPLFSETQAPNTYISLRTHASGSFFYNGVTQKVHAQTFVGAIEATNDVVSSSAQVKTFLPGGTVSSSAQYPGWVTSSGQIDYNNIQNKLSGVYSSSAQTVAAIDNQTIAPTTVNATSVTASFSGSGIGLFFVNYNTLSNIPASIVSSSTQVTSLLPADTVSSSTQVKTFLPGGTVSSSAQYPGWVTASSQIDYNSITNKLSGVYSSSAQAVAAISAQFITPSGSQFSGIVSGSGTQYRLVVPVGTNLYAT